MLELKVGSPSTSSGKRQERSRTPPRSVAVGRPVSNAPPGAAGLGVASLSRVRLQGSMDETQVIQVGRQLHGVQKLRVGVAPFPSVIFWPAFPCQEECPLALRVPGTLRTYSPHSTQKVEKKDSGFPPFFPRLPASQSRLTVAALAQLPVQRHGEYTPRSRVSRGGGACSWGPRWATPRAAGRRHRRFGWWLSGFRGSGLGNKDSGYRVKDIGV